MKNVKLIIIITFMATSIFANEYVALAKDAIGNVQVKQEKGSKPIKSGDKLFVNDVIVTGKKSNVAIVFNDGSVLKLGEKSFLTIDNFVFEPLEKEYDFKLNLKKGVGVFESGKIGKLAPKSFNMKIPQGVIGIRGTKFIVDVD